MNTIQVISKKVINIR